MSAKLFLAATYSLALTSLIIAGLTGNVALFGVSLGFSIVSICISMKIQLNR